MKNEGRNGTGMEWVRDYIRDIPDFPKKGIVFKDITPLLMSPAPWRRVIDGLVERHKDDNVNKVVGIESRGFIFGAPLAYRLNCGFVPIRKLGKLPSDTVRASYDLEYGSATVEIHRDAIQAGERVLLMDDLLATGGTMAASCQLVEQLGGKVVGCSFLVELAFLKGREKLAKYSIQSFIAYEKE